MATLQTYINEMPQVLIDKYAEARWLFWANQILDRLSAEHILSLLKVECGLRVTDDVYLTPPTGYRKGIALCDPNDMSIEYPYEEISPSGTTKLRLVGHTVDEVAAEDTANTLSLQTTSSVTVNITDAAEDDYEDYLMVVTAGTLAGNTYILSGNDASALGVTKLYFMHTLSAALAGAEATAVALYSPEAYLVLKYWATCASMAAASAEVPAKDIEEREVMIAGLRYFAEKRISVDLTVVKDCETSYEKAIQKLKEEARGASGALSVRPRRLVGMEDDSSINYLNDNDED